MLYTDEKAHAVSLYLSKTTFPESKSSYIRSFEKKMMTMKDSTIRYAGLGESMQCWALGGIEQC